jgi:hypothetical protein
VAGTATGAVTGLLAGCTGDSRGVEDTSTAETAGRFDPANWDSVRGQFALRRDLVPSPRSLR